MSLKLFRMPREKLISQRYDHTPLSKMYSVAEVREMFKDFPHVRVNCINFGGVQAHQMLHWYYKLLIRFPFLMRQLGSFLIIRFGKPAS